MDDITIPSHMKAIRYNSPKEFELVRLPVPEPAAHEILIKVQSCGICGTDLHIHDGDFESRMPVVTGHETSGIVVKMGTAVQGFNIGDKVTADNSELCQNCHFCRQGKLLYCENFQAHGVHLNGGFAEYCTYSAGKLFKFSKSSWAEATLFEAAACAIHGVDRIRPPPGSKVLLLGAGATGLCMAQLLKLNGSAPIVLAANAGQKMDLARTLRVADEYVDLDRKAPEPQWERLRHDYPYGFDIVVEATGDPSIIETAMGLCGRGGMLVLYGVYPTEALVKISPSRVFLDEITVIGSFSEMWCLPRAVAYIESGKVDVKGIVTHEYTLEEFGEALQAIREKKCIKAAVMF
ncbi:putative sorbitol dehydrogenase [Xylaria scruposa]|nr:putative sorbitol dehydrogenase [Xylaria scruposa]